MALQKQNCVAKVSDLISKAKRSIEHGKFDEAIDTALDIVRCEGRSYIGHVVLGSCHLGKKQYLSAMRHFMKAIDKDPEPLTAWEGVFRVFHVYGHLLKDKSELLRKTFQKIIETYKNDQESMQIEALEFLKIFKRIQDHKGIFLASAVLLSCPSFVLQDDAVKQEVLLTFVKASILADVKHENASVNKALERSCQSLMNSKLSDEATLEFAWKSYFNTMKKCADIREQWSMVTEECPLPTCTFNAETALLIFLETYPTYEKTEVLPFWKALPAKNNVCKLFGTIEMQDKRQAAKIALKVLKKDKFLIVGYLRLSNLLGVLGDFENAIIAARGGLRMMKKPSALYHIKYSDMVNLLQVELSKINFMFEKRIKLVGVKLSTEETLKRWFTTGPLEQSSTTLKAIEEKKGDGLQGMGEEME